VLLARVLNAAATVLAAWPLDLVASVAPDSPGWLLLRELAGGGSAVGTTRGHRHAEVASVVQSHLAGHTPRRAPAGALPPGRAPLVVPDSLRGPDGRVSATLLAAAMHGNATPRAAQIEMTDALHRWADAGIGGLMEAPTGTGKSLAVLAAALEWLASGRHRTAVISTFTKQLQAQLAHDVAALAVAAPGVLDATDVVKGMGNRLSLRGLLAVLADATWVDAGGRRRPDNRFIERVEFRELLLYLLRRLFTATDRLTSWAAHSVDPVDVPVFFGDYSGKALPVWLESLSQGSNGEYDAAAAAPVAAHTDEVGEALASHRLVLANHALLLANTDAVADLGPDTLLVVDEAHQLEDAATSALTTQLDYRSLEDLFGDLRAWVADHQRVPQTAAVAAAVGNLESLLRHENLPRTASMAFDARSAGVGTVVGSRTVTLASAYAGMAGVPQVRMLAGLLTRLSGVCTAVVGTLGTYAAANRAGMCFFELEHLQALIARVLSTATAAGSIVDDINDVLGQPPAPPAARAAPEPPPTGLQPAAESGEANDDADDADPEDDDAEIKADTDADDDSGDDGGDGSADPAVGQTVDANGNIVPIAPPPPPLPNQVVYAAETDPLRGGLRYYRFMLSSAPIDLPADPRWQRFTSTFARTYYVSATLRVAGDWGYLRGRLGLDAALPALALDTPFDLAEQAELVCLGDFPSWAEQADGAMRTVAHQLARYSAEMVRPAPDGFGRGGFDGGAMVLTTARSSAGGIADYLALELRRAGQDEPPRV
jgi:hypothetical protein